MNLATFVERLCLYTDCTLVYHRCQGKGIYLTQELDERIAGMEPQVAQLYVRRPLLIDGFKFDLRVYVLVASIRPLRVYLYKDGLARLCTSGYSRPTAVNMSDRYRYRECIIT